MAKQQVGSVVVALAMASTSVAGVVADGSAVNLTLVSLLI
jgi:hypothetical protein